jgi:predicted phage terminase large subunit-like protein
LNTAEQEVHDAILREDFGAFVRRCHKTLNPGRPYLDNWHIRKVTYELDRVRRGETKRLIINLPPRYSKSTITSVAYPAYVLGLDPTRRIIVVSSALDLAIKHSNDFRAIVNADWYKRAFPSMRLSKTKNTETEVVTTVGGYRLAMSIDGALTGRGGDILIVDDPLKPTDACSDSKRNHVNEWYGNTLVTRLDDKVNGVIIIVMQRLHPDDLCGWVLKHTPKWSHLKLAAIAEDDERIQIGEDEYHTRLKGDPLFPALEPKSVLDDLISEMGWEDFAAQYQQCPVPIGGAMIKREWIKYYDKLPTSTTSSYIFQSWDTAVKPEAGRSFSVCTTWLFHEAKYYLVDVFRDRLDFPTLKDRAIAHAEKHKPTTILVEDTAVGSALVDNLKRAGFHAVPVKPVGSKVSRMSIQSLKFERGEVLLPKEAPFLADYLAELLTFPHAPHDDQVDSTSQALAFEGRSWGWDDNSLKGLAGFVDGLYFSRYFK